MQKKIIEKILELKKKGKRIGLAHGVFDILHVGHVKYLNEAKKNIDILVVSVTADKYVNKGPHKPIFNINKRMKVLKSLNDVDYVIESNHGTAKNVIQAIKPNYYIKGKDYLKNKDVTKNLQVEIKLVKKYGGKVIFTNTELHSSSKIINEKYSLVNPKAQKIIKSIDPKKIKNKFLDTFENKINKKILVIGEPIQDIFKYVKPSGKSNKSNIISTLYQNKNEIAGGSILVANTLSEFCKNVSLTCFEKNNKNFYMKNLNKNIKKIFIKSNFDIIKKTRYIDEYSGNKFFQVTENEEENFDKNHIKEYLKILKKEIKKVDYVFIFDFGYNAVKNEVLNLINQIPSKKKIINCQTNSFNFGYNNFHKYNGSELMIIDEIEFRLGCQSKSEKIKNLIESKLINSKKFNSLTVTLGKYGCITKEKNSTRSVFIPSLFDITKNSIGCGDIFASIFGLLSLSKRFTVLEKSLLSHLAAGLYGLRKDHNQRVNFVNLYKTINSFIT